MPPHSFLLRLVFPCFSPETEFQFQANYSARVRASLRLVSPLLVALFLVNFALGTRRPTPYDWAVTLPQLGLWSLVCALMWKPHGKLNLERFWPPIFVALGWLAALLMLGRLAPLLTQDIARMREAGMRVPTDPQQKFYFMLQFAVLVVSLTVLRLQFRWAILLYGGVTAIGIVAFLRGLPPSPELYRDVRFAFLPAVLIVSVLLLTALVQEQLARSAFLANHQLELANHQLEAERNDEKRQREQTESKLHVLSQAIGGIVHDLGNPLASVQMGSETLELFLKDEMPDKALLSEFAHAIGDGAQMLNFLRLSLIEQTRVLEGKPTPVDLKPVALRATLHKGVQFQKPHILGIRTVQLQEGDAQLCADEMKLVTVWMNLIGNALKYSDGEVQVRWSEFHVPENNDVSESKCLLVAVADRGTKGQGISRANAAKLFSAFGRLAVHSQIEGTGLGLLSVQKIMEAHGGQVWIEGFQDGTPQSPSFSTAQGAFPAQLKGDDRTTFVVSCPLAPTTKS